jgi:hypothetical protein
MLPSSIGFTYFFDLLGRDFGDQMTLPLPGVPWAAIGYPQ